MLAKDLIMLASICNIQHPTTLPCRILIHTTSFGQEEPIPRPLQKSKSSFRSGLQYLSLCCTDHQMKGDVIQLINNSAQGPSNYFKIAPSPHIPDSSETVSKPFTTRESGLRKTYSHQIMALSMMVEKESDRIEGNEFESLWRRVAPRDGRVRYDRFVSWSCLPLVSPLC